DENNGRTKTFNLVEEGQVVKKYDAGLILPGTVEAQVWNDKDGDGKRDDSNAAVSGVTVRLLDSNNKFIKSAKTNGSGVATIKDVPADKEVKLEFAKPSGSAFTKKDKNGVNDNEDSDADENNGRTKTFNLVEEGQVVKKYDAGLILPEESSVVVSTPNRSVDQRASTTAGEMTLFPVPVVSNLNIRFKHTKDERMHYSIMDLQGRVLMNKSWDVFKGHNQLEVDVTELVGGQYIFVITGQKEIQRKLFIVIRD
ncbi:MAG: SdrD B-like domain-containing protein, partial [Bacteroidota bacterium]